MVCRRCRYEFRVNLDGVIDPDPPSTVPASADSGFESSETTIMETSGVIVPSSEPDGPTEVQSFGDDGETRADLPAVESIPPPDGFGDTTSTDVGPALDSFPEAVAPPTTEIPATGGDALPFTAVEPSGSTDHFLGGETQAIEPDDHGLADFPDASAPDLESLPGVGPAAAIPEPFEASEASEPHQDPLAAEAAGVSPELLQARDQARGGTVADSELPQELGLAQARQSDFDDELTGVSEALPSHGHTPSTGGGRTKERAQRVFATAQVSAREMAAVWNKQPLGVRIATGLLLLTLIVVGVAVASSFGPKGPESRWVKFAVVLRTGPGVGDGYRRVDQLPKGAQVTAYEATTNFTLVRDAFGRVGYVTNESLADAPPTPNPSEPFADCRQAPIETNLEPCQGRARAQLDRCEAGCSDQSCIDACATQFTDCMAGCETRLVVVEDSPTVADAEREDAKPREPPEPVEAPESAEASDEATSVAEVPDEANAPGSEPEDEVAEAEDERTDKKKKRTRKKRRRKKRR